MKNKVLVIISLILVIGIATGIIIYVKNKKYEYEIVEILNEQIEYYKLEQDGKYGVIDKLGNILIEPKYSDLKIPNPIKSIFIVSNDGQDYKAIDSNENQMFQQYDNVEAISINSISSNIPYEKSVLKYKSGGLYGIMDFEGNKITENIYNSITNIDYKEGNLKVEENGQYGVINIKGTTIIKSEYEAIIADGYYDEQTAYKKAGFILRIKTDDGYRFGYANNKGKIILEPLYNEINRITEIISDDVYLITSNNGRYGVIKNGKEVLKNEYTNIDFDKNNNLLIVQKDQAKGVVDLDGNNVVPIDYDDIIIGGKYIDAQKDEELVIFDSQGNNLKTDIISYNQVNDNYAIVIDKENNYNIIGNDGNKKLKENFTYIEYFTDDKFIATKDSKAGVINADGKELIEFKYDAIQQIDGINVLQALENETNRTDIIDSQMNINKGIENAYIIKKENYIKLYSENNMKYYDFNGKEVTYKELFPQNSIFAEQKDGKWGLVDSKGNVVVNYEYDIVTEQNGQVVGVKKDGKWQILNINGNKETEDTFELSWIDVTFLGKYYKINNSKDGIVYSGTM